MNRMDLPSRPREDGFFRGRPGPSPTAMIFMGSAGEIVRGWPKFPKGNFFRPKPRRARRTQAVFSLQPEFPRPIEEAAGRSGVFAAGFGAASRGPVEGRGSPFEG